MRPHAESQPPLSGRRVLPSPRQRELSISPPTSHAFPALADERRRGGSQHFLNLVFDAADGNERDGTLPISLVTIFCAFVRRLPAEFDIQAKPIGFPGVLLAGVANRGKSNWVYVNVFSWKVVEVADLHDMLRGTWVIITAVVVRKRARTDALRCQGQRAQARIPATGDGPGHGAPRRAQHVRTISSTRRCINH